jgi:hypothetical protein
VLALLRNSPGKLRALAHPRGGNEAAMDQSLREVADVVEERLFTEQLLNAMSIQHGVCDWRGMREWVEIMWPVVWTIAAREP